MFGFDKTKARAKVVFDLFEKRLLAIDSERHEEIPSNQSILYHIMDERFAIFEMFVKEMRKALDL
jgi:hypothetical protein